MIHHIMRCRLSSCEQVRINTETFWSLVLIYLSLNLQMIDGVRSGILGILLKENNNVELQGTRQSRHWNAWNWKQSIAISANVPDGPNRPSTHCKCPYPTETRRARKYMLACRLTPRRKRQTSKEFWNYGTITASARRMLFTSTINLRTAYKKTEDLFTRMLL